MAAVRVHDPGDAPAAVAVVAASRRTNWILPAFALALLLLVAIAAIAYRQSLEAQSVARTMLLAHELLARIEGLESMVAAMESEHRGFLALGARDFEARRERRYAEAVAGLEAISGDLADAGGRAALQDVIARLELRHARMVEASRLAASEGLDAARAHFRAGGDLLTDSVRAAFEDFNAHERRVLTARAQRSAEADRSLRLLLIVGTGLVLAALAGGLFALLRQARQMQALNRALAVKANQLEATNGELESFSYSVSHDLRAPLRHIDGYAQMLEEDAVERLDAEHRRYLANIRDGARRMGVLIDDLLDLSRLGRRPMARQPVDMQALASGVVAELTPADAADRVELGVLPPAMGDSALLRQVWVNLVANALKYSAPRGAGARVLIDGHAADGEVRYTVRDNGVGFDMRFADKLFGVFQRLHRQEEFEGTGVGLAIVQRIVVRHGGTVAARAEPDRGATFEFTLPRGEES